LLLVWHVAARLFQWKFRFRNRTLLVLSLCLLGGPVGWFGGRIYTMARWAHYFHGVRANIHSLASERPANITQEHWDEAVSWAGIAFANMWPWDADNWPDLKNFSAALTERMATGDNLATLQWVWDQLEQKREENPSYAATFKPVRAMNPDPITDANLDHLWGLSACMNLDLSDTEVGDTGLSCLASAPNLAGLDLSNTRVTDRGLARLSALPQLKVLSLKGCRITGAGLADLKGAAKLIYLTLDGTQIGDRQLVGIGLILQLEYLDLGNTVITDDGLPCLAQLVHLKELNLLGTQITDAGLVHLQKMKQLESLNLSGAHVTDAGMKKLQQALPTCKIRK